MSRVGNTRFECNFLNLAVEYQNNEFALFESDGRKCELSRAPEHETIAVEIALNSLRVSLNYPGRGKK